MEEVKKRKGGGKFFLEVNPKEEGEINTDEDVSFTQQEVLK